MVIDAKLHPSLLRETLIPIKTAGASVPGGRVSRRTMERWIKVGVNGVRLESCKIGCSRHTSEEAILRFLEAVNRTMNQTSL